MWHQLLSQPPSCLLLPACQWPSPEVTADTVERWRELTADLLWKTGRPAVQKEPGSLAEPPTHGCSLALPPPGHWLWEQAKACRTSRARAHTLPAHACRACPQGSGAAQSVGAKRSRHCHVPPHKEPVGHHWCQAQPLHKTPLAPLLPWLSWSCLCSHTTQPVLHHSTAPPFPPPLRQQQTAPTRQAPISLIQ